MCSKLYANTVLLYCRGLEHPWIFGSLEVLEAISCGYQRMTARIILCAFISLWTLALLSSVKTPWLIMLLGTLMYNYLFENPAFSFFWSVYLEAELLDHVWWICVLIFCGTASTVFPACITILHSLSGAQGSSFHPLCAYLFFLVWFFFFFLNSGHLMSI